MTRRDQQGALIQVKVEVESGLGIGGKRGKDCMLAHERGMGLSRIVGQLQGQVAVVGERSQYHASGALALDTSFQHVLEGKVESEEAEGVAHAHTFRAQDRLNYVVSDKETGAIDSVEEIHERGQLRSYSIQYFIFSF